ncbi:MAG: DUF1992 domain-containing protein [Desulfobacterales bacterium]|nr:DUF1992 domain-containing protein [Desulfobacterales bacterium]
MLNIIQLIAERKISAAISEGQLNNSTLHGKPLPVENNQLVPPDLRMAYKILKNAGYVPPEVEARKEIFQLRELIARTSDEHTRLQQLKKLEVLVFKLNSMRSRPANLEAQEQYFPKVVDRITVRTP